MLSTTKHEHFQKCKHKAVYIEDIIKCYHLIKVHFARETDEFILLIIGHGNYFITERKNETDIEGGNIEVKVDGEYKEASHSDI